MALDCVRGPGVLHITKMICQMMVGQMKPLLCTPTYLELDNLPCESHTLALVWLRGSLAADGGTEVTNHNLVGSEDDQSSGLLDLRHPRSGFFHKQLSGQASASLIPLSPHLPNFLRQNCCKHPVLGVAS